LKKDCAIPSLAQSAASMTSEYLWTSAKRSVASALLAKMSPQSQLPATANSVVAAQIDR
jgi:hypothetical protein